MQSHIARFGFRLLSLLLAVQMSMVPLPAVSRAADGAADRLVREPVFRVTETRSELEVIEKFAKIVELDSKIRRVDGFDPAVIAVNALSPNQIRVQAVTPGITTMVLVDEDDQAYTIEVFVTGDARHLQAYLHNLFPKASVSAFKVRESVVLRGWVTQPEHITEMVEIAEQFFPRVLNQVKVGGVQQVLLKVKVMEVQRSKIRQLGINWIYLNQKGHIASTPGSIVPITETTLPFGGPPSIVPNAKSLANATLNVGIANDNNIFQSFIDALKKESLLKILAEPEIVTTNGRPANMLSGGEFPILVPQSLGTVTIQWREFGVRLEAVPIILGNGFLRLELQPEVSERDFTNAVQVNGLTVPGLTTRRVNTQVEMKFGQTLMLAGLISTRQTSETSKIPFLGELPLIGAAFRKVSDQDTETELVIMVTPEMIAPLEPGQVPLGGPGQGTDVPTDRELYNDGMIEVPKYGEECIDCQQPIYSGSTMPTMMQNATGIIGAGSMTPEPTPAGPNEPINSPPPPEPLRTPPADSPAGAPRFPSQPKAQGASTQPGRVVSPSAEPSAAADPFQAEPTAAGQLPTRKSSPEESVGNRLQSKRQRPGLIGPQ